MDDVRSHLKSLGNRYSIEILQVLSPKAGEIIPHLGWEEIVEGILEIKGYKKQSSGTKSERTQSEAEYEEEKQRYTSGGTLYESMNKLVEAGFVIASGERGKKQRTFMITHDGRLALNAIQGMLGPIIEDTEVARAAKILLKHKNFIRLLPAQKRFLEEIGDIDGNLIIQMPPGSGKTFLAMIAVLLRLQNGGRCLYLSPYISINRQVVHEYGELFEELGYSMIRLDGSCRATEEELEDANFVVAIYESALIAALGRKDWTEEFDLVVVDELTHLSSWSSKLSVGNLGTDRSTKLDVLITLLQESSQIITLSSRFGGTEMVADWLNAQVFRPSVILSPDEYIVTRDENVITIESSDGALYTEIESEDMLESGLNHMGNYDEKSVLVVVGYRSMSEYVAEKLSKSRPRKIDDEVIDYVIGLDTNIPVVERLRNVLEKGVAFHHAGVPPDIRGRLEEKIKTGEIRTVASTTGITSGTSFPFDAVFLNLDRSMRYLIARSRYLQIAGRIGEYHLSESGGSVYVLFYFPPKEKQEIDRIVETLLYRPLKPLDPGTVFPSLLTSLMVREVAKKRDFSYDTMIDAVMGTVEKTFRSMNDPEYLENVANMFGAIFEWMLNNSAFAGNKSSMKLAMSTKYAAESGLDILRYLDVKEDLENITDNEADKSLMYLILQFELPQAVRPRTSIALEIEIKATGLEPPDEWYLNFVNYRTRIKTQVLTDWLEEKPLKEVMGAAYELIGEMSSEGKPVGGNEIDEGDFASLIEICSNVAENLSSYFHLMKQKNAAERLHIFSRQLLYGVKSDLATSDLLELDVQYDDNHIQPLLRKDARVLFDNGYTTISEVVRKDIGAKKKGLARDRFAENSGLETEFALEVYKSALAEVRSRMEEDD